jgi:glutamate dehydrogenase/leucine dehydrogenase
VRIQKLETTDAFVVWDLEGAERSVGIARLAPKILQEGAEMLARSVTYSFAAFGVKASGASAGINAKPDGRDAALEAFVTELAPLAGAGALVLHAGSGLQDADLAPLTRSDVAALTDDELTAHSAVVATEATIGSLDGKSVAVAGTGPVSDAAAIALGDRGAQVDDGGLDTPGDALLVAGKSGMITHEVAEGIKAGAVVPLTPLPLTAKAYAVLRRAGVTYVPDFVALAAPLLAACDSEHATEPIERVRATVSELAPSGPDGWLVAVGMAEAFLSTWQEALPFGRPLAT